MNDHPVRVEEALKPITIKVFFPSDMAVGQDRARWYLENAIRGDWQRYATEGDPIRLMRRATVTFPSAVTRPHQIEAQGSEGEDVAWLRAYATINKADHWPKTPEILEWIDSHNARVDRALTRPDPSLGSREAFESQCDFCAARYSTRWEREEHMRRVHGKAAARTRERTPDEAPEWMNADWANAWAQGFNAALASISTPSGEGFSSLRAQEPFAPGGDVDASRQSGFVPDGWALVPKVASAEMLLTVAPLTHDASPEDWRTAETALFELEDAPDPPEITRKQLLAELARDYRNWIAAAPSASKES